MSMPPVPVLVREPVRWGDVDPVAITRFDAYTRFLEIGEDELWRAAGMPLHGLQEAHDVWFPRKLMHVDYLVPSRLGDMLTVASYLSRVGTSGCTLHVDTLNDDATVLHAAAHLVIVCVTRDGFVKRDIPEVLRTQFAPLVITPEEARSRARAVPRA
ncbi:MAG: thioesterase family protein [Gemmatimonadetes bacterium]|nr:thioesterase family protein [Gemmatimonadota bacterium]